MDYALDPDRVENHAFSRVEASGEGPRQRKAATRIAREWKTRGRDEAIATTQTRQKIERKRKKELSMDTTTDSHNGSDAIK